MGAFLKKVRLIQALKIYWFSKPPVSWKWSWHIATSICTGKWVTPPEGNREDIY